MVWTVTVEIDLPNLVAARRRLAAELPDAQVLTESRGGSRRQLTISVEARSGDEAARLARKRVAIALVGLPSGSPRVVSAFADPD